MLMLFFLYRNFHSKNQQSKFRFSFKLFPDYDWLLVATIFGGKVFFLLPFSCDTEFNIINMMHSNNSNLHIDILNFVYLQWSLPLYFMGLHWVFDFSNAVVILANARRKEKNLNISWVEMVEPLSIHTWLRPWMSSELFIRSHFHRSSDISSKRQAKLEFSFLSVMFDRYISYNFQNLVVIVFKKQTEICEL